MNKEKVLELLKNEDSRQNILQRLTQTNDSEIIQEIIKLFDDENIEIRGEVFSTLFLNENNILEQLICALKNKSKSIRAYTTLVLANRNEKESIHDIIKLTKDDSGLVRTCAYGAIGHLGTKVGIKELHEGIYDSNIEAVKSAAYALIKMGERISKKEIEELDKFNDADFKKILKLNNGPEGI